MNPFRVLITGGTGLLGRNLLETVPPGVQALATCHRLAPPAEWAHLFRPLDLSNEEGQMASLFKQFQPDWVIHTASVGSVDEAEQRPEQVRQVNVQGTERLVEACLRHSSRLLYVSSNAVFDGTRPPYREEDPICPINHYGQLKAEAEERVRRCLPSSVILRPILMYGWPFPGARQNVLTRWLADLNQGKVLQVAYDIISMPLAASNCAQAMWAAVLQGKNGVYHVAGRNQFSLDAFAREVAQAFGFSLNLIQAVPNDHLKLPARRPRDTSFVTEKMEKELGVKPVGIREGLRTLQRTPCTSF